MAKDCPCGCGRQVSYWSRRIAKNATVIDQALVDLDRIVAPTMQDDEEAVSTYESFCSEGSVYRNQIYGIVHGDFPSQYFDRGAMYGWVERAAAWCRGTAELWRRLEQA